MLSYNCFNITIKKFRSETILPAKVPETFSLFFTNEIVTNFNKSLNGTRDVALSFCNTSG